jgi:hypothetical protein
MCSMSSSVTCSTDVGLAHVHFYLVGVLAAELGSG